MVRIKTSNVGGTDEELKVDWSDFQLVGSEGLLLYSFDPSCGVIPDELEVPFFTGGSSEGNVCFVVGESEEEFLLTYSPLSFDKRDRRWLNLGDNPSPTATATQTPTATPTTPTATATPVPTATTASTVTQAAFFTFGSHKDDVARIQGTPTSVNVYSNLGEEVWGYVSSTVTFDTDTNQPELPIPSCLDPSNAPSSTRAIVVSLTDAVNHPIKLTKPSLGVVSQRPQAAEVAFTTFALPSNSSGHAPRPWLPLFTSDDLKDNRYAGAGWSPAIRSNTCRNTSRDTATSAS